MPPDTWERRQSESVARYASARYTADIRRFRLFGNFIGATLTDRNATVLDIGCGIGFELPHYVDELGLTNYIGLDPLPANANFKRLTAKAEEIPLPDASVDAAIFATSFDHIADDKGALRELKRVLKPNGRVYMWQGISDPDTFGLTSTLHRITRGPHMIPAVALQAAKMSYLMRKRKRDLAKGNRLDNAHERYFTREGLRAYLTDAGFEIIRELEPYGMPSMFIEARP